MGAAEDYQIHSVPHPRDRALRQPNLIRQRHRFQGPRESEKINLEINQIKYDLMNINRKLAVVEEEVYELFDLIFDNNDLSPAALMFIGDLLDITTTFINDVSDYGIEP